MNEQEVQEKRRADEEVATEKRAQILGLPYLDTREFEDAVALAPNVLSKEEMHAGTVVPLQEGGDGQHYQFMVTSQTPSHVIRELRDRFEGKAEVDIFLISQSAFRVFMLRYDPPPTPTYEDIKIADEGDSETLASVSQTLEKVSSDRLFDFVLDQADKLKASDIHIENLLGAIRVRMRVDGILHIVAELSRDRYRILMGELSSRANVSAAATTPQSGHMQKEIHSGNASHLLNIRVETVPTMYGQDAVLRLFNFDESLLNLDLLGLTEIERREINEIVSHPRGLVMMVGPTGSGKSTTLYSILNALNTPDRKIITLEDPIEYGISGIAQIPIDTTKGQNFADGLRSVLRLDPDVVMVGEIRDSDTARTAIQASITGHLVLTSFHANSTSAAFSRMVDMIGVNPIFSTSIRLVMAQRLVRRLTDSKEIYEPDENVKQYIRDAFSGVDPQVLADHDVNLDEIRLAKPVKTEDDPFGFEGRMAIMEQLVVGDAIQAFIRGDVQDIHTEAIEKTARENNMLTLEQKGIIAALHLETTLDEVERVI